MKIYFETFGCTSNRADTEIMEGIIRAGGEHEVVYSLDECDIAVVNSCAVVAHTQRKVLRYVTCAKSGGKKVILAGCLNKIDPLSAEEAMPDFSINPDSIGFIGSAVQMISQLPGKPPHFGGDKAAMKTSFNGGVVTAIPIAEGCVGRCSYCATRLSRGRLRSFPLESIIKTAENAVSAGCKEIQLTAQDTGQYGIDIDSNLPDLLRSIVEVKGNFRIRVGMMNPLRASLHLDDLIEVFKDGKMYKYLHIPVQSGDDGLLGHMNRGYKIDDFIKIVKRFKKEFQELTISTDVIVGYPTEDNGSFTKTYEMIQDVRPSIVNITRFSPRPQTPASKLKDLPDRIKKERSRKMSLLVKNISNRLNERYVGRDVEVLITEKGKNGTLLGRTDAYKQVVLTKGALGHFRKVRISSATPHYLVAE